MHAHTHTHTYIHTYTHTCTGMYACSHACVHTHVGINGILHYDNNFIYQFALVKVTRSWHSNGEVYQQTVRCHRSAEGVEDIGGEDSSLILHQEL